MRTVARCTKLLGMLAAATLLAACSSTPSVQKSDEGRTIAVAGQPTTAAEQALLTGTATWSENDCLAVETENGTYLVVFPFGTSLDDDDTVRMPDGFEIGAGDEVALGGGFRTTDGEVPGIPESCVTDEIFWASGERG